MFKYLYSTLTESAREMVEMIVGKPEPEASEELMAYRKQIRKDPPALIRIQTLGWRQPCGHHQFEWNSVRLCCDQCVREGRQVPIDRRDTDGSKTVYPLDDSSGHAGSAGD